MSGRLKVHDLVKGGRNTVLFVCVANSARSQMAEGFARFLAPSSVAVLSAGSAPTKVNPHAVAAMKEVGIDISSQISKAVGDLSLDSVAVVVTLCADAECPAILVGPEVERIHWPLPDPAAESVEPIERFREVRDELRELVSGLF